MSNPDDGALTAEGWASRYIDPYNNLRPVPANGGVPDKRVRTGNVAKLIEAFGDTIDRLGDPHGEFFTILGGSFDQRALLPEAASARLHTYRITGKLPEGWEVELGENAPAFGRSGGARYVVFLGANGQKMNAFELVDVGVLDDITA
jgi:hypothetical protein